MFLMDVDALPVPPQTVVKRLRQIDPRLGLKFFDLGTTSDNPMPYWGIIYTWHKDDPRRQLILRGDFEPDADHDLIGTLPMDCAPDEAYGYIMNHFQRQSANGRADVADLLKRVEQYNGKATEDAIAPTLELAGELIEDNAGTLFEEQGKTTKRVFQRGKGKAPKKTKGS